MADGCQPGAQISRLWPRGGIAGVALPGLGDDGLEEGRLGGELLEQGGLRDPGRFGDPREGGAVVATVQEQFCGRGGDRLALLLGEPAMVRGEFCCHAESMPQSRGESLDSPRGPATVHQQASRLTRI